MSSKSSRGVLNILHYHYIEGTEVLPGVERDQLMIERSKGHIQLALAEVNCLESLHTLNHRSVTAAETRRLIDSLGGIVQDDSIYIRLIDEPNGLVEEAML